MDNKTNQPKEPSKTPHKTSDQAPNQSSTTVATNKGKTIDGNKYVPNPPEQTAVDSNSPYA